MVKIIVSEVFLPDVHQNLGVFLPLAAEKELVNSLKLESTC